MDIILISFLVSILISVRTQETANDYLSSDNMLPVRGIMAVAIILHHMSQRTSGGHLFPFMVHMGYLVVAVFFFLSGYGLMLQYLKKGNEYLKNFWRRRILYVSAILALATVIYSTYHLLNGDFVPSLTIVANSWYMVVQIFLYVFFFVAFRIAGERYLIGILSVFATQTLMVIIMRAMSLPVIWYMSNYAFIFGLFVAWQKGKIAEIVQRRFTIAMLVSAGMFGVFSILPFVLRGGYDVCRMASTICFTTIVILICSKISVKSKIWIWLGKISLEIYLYHGIVYMILRKLIINDFWWTFSTIVLTIPVAYCAFLIDTRIKRALKV